MTSVNALATLLEIFFCRHTHTHTHRSTQRHCKQQYRGHQNSSGYVSYLYTILVNA